MKKAMLFVIVLLAYGIGLLKLAEKMIDSKIIKSTNALIVSLSKMG